MSRLHLCAVARFHMYLAGKKKKIISRMANAFCRSEQDFSCYDATQNNMVDGRIVVSTV